MHKQITIQTLRNQGKTNAEITRTLGIHRNTVWKVLKRETLREKQTRVKTFEL
jgi:IS30 family transposase